MNKCKEKFLSIAWDTEIWVAEEPTYMVQKTGINLLKHIPIKLANYKI